MEAIIAILESPGGELVLQVVAIIMGIWIIKDVRRGRQLIHGRIDELGKDFQKHERDCGERWGQIKTILKLR